MRSPVGPGRARGRDRYHTALLATFVAALLCLGLSLVEFVRQPAPPPQPSAVQGFGDGHASASAGPTAESGKDARRKTVAPMPASRPVRVRIPSIGVDAPLTGLGLTDKGSLDVPPPADPNLAGWYEDGVTPGAVGTALIVGHVDNKKGPAVFYPLGALKKGHTIDVDRADGRTAVFTVDAVEVYDDAHFPDEKVYGPSDRPELRVLTCGGGYDRDEGGYQGNVVVFAHLTAAERSPARPSGSPDATPDASPHASGKGSVKVSAADRDFA
jgi:sortase (surface protein transpeptidase)